jgi:hypothetical protein
MDQILKSLDLKGNISTRMKQTCAYADDILILARTQQELTNDRMTEFPAGQLWMGNIGDQISNSFTCN